MSGLVSAVGVTAQFVSDVADPTASAPAGLVAKVEHRVGPGQVGVADRGPRPAAGSRDGRAGRRSWPRRRHVAGAEVDGDEGGRRLGDRRFGIRKSSTSWPDRSSGDVGNQPEPDRLGHRRRGSGARRRRRFRARRDRVVARGRRPLRRHGDRQRADRPVVARPRLADRAADGRRDQVGRARRRGRLDHGLGGLRRVLQRRIAARHDPRDPDHPDPDGRLVRPDDGVDRGSHGADVGVDHRRPRRRADQLGWSRSGDRLVRPRVRRVDADDLPDRLLHRDAGPQPHAHCSGC